MKSGNSFHSADTMKDRKKSNNLVKPLRRLTPDGREKRKRRE